MNKLTTFSIVLVTVCILVQPACKREAPKPEALRLSCIDIATETILTDRFTDPTVPDYVISCSITVEALLSIQPGVIIEFESGAGLIITDYGTLIARGTSISPIVFKGSTDAPGSWKGLYFESTYSTFSELSYVTVTGAGSESFTTENILANIRVDESSKVKIDYCTIEKSLNNGMYVGGNSSNGYNPLSSFTYNNFTGNTGCPLIIDPVVLSVIEANNTFTGNGKQFICLHGTEIETNQQWNPMQIPYLVDGDMSIGSSSNSGSVIISQGTNMFFTSGSGISVGYYGYLKMTGTASQRIVLTGETATAGSWQGIDYQSTTSYNSIYYTDISFGGCCPFTSGDSDAGNIVIGGSSPGRVSVYYSTINNSAACGVKVKTINGSSFVQGSGVTFNGNASGNVCL